MRLRPGTMVVLSIAALALPAAAKGQTTPTNATSARSAEDNQIICKREKKQNSRFEDKTCRTRLQWEQLRLENQRNLKEMIDRPEIETQRGG